MAAERPATCVQNGAKGNGVKDIPTPEVLLVPTYKTDYLPTFREKGIYTRAGTPHPLPRSESPSARGSLASAVRPPLALHSWLMSDGVRRF